MNKIRNAIKNNIKNYIMKYYVLENEKKDYVYIADIILSIIYFLGSLYIVFSDIKKIQMELKNPNVILEEVLKETRIILLLALNIIILLKLNIKYCINIKKHTSQQLKEYGKGMRLYEYFYIVAWKRKVDLIWLGYAMVILILVCSLFFEANISSLMLVVIISIVTTLVLDMWDNIEGMFGLEPIAYTSKRK